MAGFTLTPVCVAATSGHRVRGMSERGPWLGLLSLLSVWLLVVTELEA